MRHAGAETSYKLYRFYPVQICLAYGLLAVSMVLAIHKAVINYPSWKVIWPVFPAFGFFWNTYWILGRVSLELKSKNGEVHWRSPLRRGVVPISELRHARPAKFSGSFQVYETGEGTAFVAGVWKGLDGFNENLRASNPHFSYRFGRQWKLVQRWPGKARIMPIEPESVADNAA